MGVCFQDLSGLLLPAVLKFGLGRGCVKTQNYRVLAGLITMPDVSVVEYAT